MKKFIKHLALASFAILGTLVSCQIENIQTTFNPKNAKATITIKAYDALSGNVDVSGSPDLSITVNGSLTTPSVKGNEITIEGNPEIKAQTVTIEAKYHDRKGQTSVDVKPLRSGGKAAYPAIIVIGSASYKATAVVQVSVWDRASQKDVTSDAEIKLEGYPSGCTLEGEKGSYSISSTDPIPAFSLKIKTTYGGETQEQTLGIRKIERDETLRYGTSFSFGEVGANDPAVAVIKVAVIDNAKGTEVSDKATISAKLESGSKAGVSCKGNEITVTAGSDLRLAAQKVTITTVYDNRTETSEFSIPEIAAGKKQTFITSVIFQSVGAKATAAINVSVYDAALKKDVTSTAEIKLENIPDGCTLSGEKGNYTITSAKDIKAFNLKVSATYDGKTQNGTIAVSEVKLNETKYWSYAFTFGQAPVTEPAIAKIQVHVIDNATGTDVSDKSEISATLAAGSKATLSKEGNTIILTAGTDLKIAAQDVTITAKYNNRTESVVYSVPEIGAGSVGNFSTNIMFKSLDPTTFLFVQVNVWDKTAQKDVTADADIKIAGVPESCTTTGGNGGSYIITSKDEIPAFNLVASATYKEETKKDTIAVAKISKGTAANYTVKIEVGEVVKVPAVAKINVTSFDALLGEVVTAQINAQLSQGSDATAVVIDSLVTITGGSKTIIEAQDVIISATYQNVTKSDTLAISAVEEAAVAEYAVNFVFNKAEYFINQVGEPLEEIEVGTFTSNHGSHTYTHDYSHASLGHGHGTGEWLYNETEFKLETTIDYLEVTGIVKREIIYADGINAQDKINVDELAIPYAENKVETPMQLNVEVSAFAMYSAYATKVTKIYTYEVTRVLNGETDKAVVVGTIKVYTVATSAEYCEAAMPGHAGHYAHGHGHADEHGYSSNAGGGIIWAE